MDMLERECSSARRRGRRARISPQAPHDSRPPSVAQRGLRRALAWSSVESAVENVAHAATHGGKPHGDDAGVHAYAMLAYKQDAHRRDTIAAQAARVPIVARSHDPYGDYAGAMISKRRGPAAGATRGGGSRVYSAYAPHRTPPYCTDSGAGETDAGAMYG
jgi:hypothetical protein